VHGGEAAWEILWPVMQWDQEFGKQVIEKSAIELDRDFEKFASVLSSDQLAELYLWLNKGYPPSEDPEHKGAHLVGTRETVADVRGSILTYLQKAGTTASCEALKRIARELPESRWRADGYSR
jgi:hypothetical protein